MGMGARPYRIKDPEFSKKRSIAGSIGGLVNRSRHNPKDYTAKARQTFIQSFYDATDPDLPPMERAARAEAARKVYYLRLNLQGQQVRRAKKELAEAEAKLARDTARAAGSAS